MAVLRLHQTLFLAMALTLMLSVGSTNAIRFQRLLLQDCCSGDYYHDESQNSLGPNQCSTDCDCDGARTCSQWGWCQGDAAHGTADESSSSDTTYDYYDSNTDYGSSTTPVTDASSSTTESGSTTPAVSSSSGGMQDVVDRHNYYRAPHHVNALSWDDTLAASAQAWADGCSMSHSGDAGVGENIAWGSFASFPAVVDAWYNEVSQYDFANGGFSEATGHFTQVVWASTTSVGCALANCQVPFYVCQYAPPGNVAGEYQQNVFAA